MPSHVPQTWKRWLAHRRAAQAAMLRGCVPTASHSKSDGCYKSICLLSLRRWAQARKAAPYLMGVLSLLFLPCTVTSFFLLRRRLSASLCCCPGPRGTGWPTCSMAIRRASAAVACHESTTLLPASSKSSSFLAAWSSCSFALELGMCCCNCRPWLSLFES